jgi:Leucine-rich repeat (LRR) protein
MKLRANIVQQHMKKDRNANGFSLDLHMQQIPSIDNIRNFLTPDEIVNLDLSFNYFKEIEPIFNIFNNLQWLDLSANSIQSIENLHGLTGLQYLNLSTNNIIKVIGLEFPESLRVLVIF